MINKPGALKPFNHITIQPFLYLIPLFLFSTLSAQINPENITIARDQWGVPHIFAKTDEEVAYGLAWATAEDAFPTMQESLLMARKELASVKGKESAIVDIACHLIKAEETVNAKYETDLSPKFRKVLEGFAAGVNSYAEKHPKEILKKGIFPISGKDILQGYMLALTFMSHAQRDIEKVFKDKVEFNENQLPAGSNAFAISKKRTKDGKTYLGINSHQPLEGAYAWYEVHLASEEGLNILGGTFPGGMCIFHGVNENLGWAHTLNQPDLSDIYKLTMHPTEKNKYRFDGKWETLEERPVKIKVKLGPIKIPVKRTFYWSKHGAVIKNKSGYYAVRFAANMDIRVAEQWYWMNKAQNFDEFKKALEIQGLPSMNIIYADKWDNIYYLGNAKFSKRHAELDYTKALPGDSSYYLWNGEFYPIDSLPQILNPDCGYVFNTNNTPLNSTCAEENIKGFNPTFGYTTKDNNRSLSFQHLISQYDKISYDDFKKIKYDRGIMTPAYTTSMENLEEYFHLDPKKYPDISDVIERIGKWDRQVLVNSKPASIMVLSLQYLIKILREREIAWGINTLPEKDFADAMRHAKKHLLKHFKTIDVKLGDVQKHVRGDVELPIGGSVDVLAAIYSEPYKKGKLKAFAGESYIELVRFTENGPEIETVNCYGSSNRENSPHYTDQMEMFVNQELKPMTLDKETILKEAEKVYHPQ